jgi:3-hydroxyisobutyrate dehydrogenase-like beta-hydroxyacid dehydrogenase
MQLGLIGLGKMGGNMAERLRVGGMRWLVSTSIPVRWRGSRLPEVSASPPSAKWLPG